MLEVIYNDPFTTLSIIDNADIEKAYIVDDELQVYATINYHDFDIDEMLETWQKTLTEYLKLYDFDFSLEHRIMLADKSINAFKEFLENMEDTNNL